MPRVLFLTHPQEDYLQDQLLFGLRQLLGAECVDWPRKEVLYADCPRPKQSLYGRGFTLWKLLPEIDIARPVGRGPEIAAGFDAVLFGAIVRQKALFRQWAPRLRGLGAPRIAILDGRDKPRLFWPALGRGVYFKRERTALSRLVTEPISFSIPAEKIVDQVSAKQRLFATHVQCEVAYGHPWIRTHCHRKYVFEDEASYRADLQASHFAVSMKKGGFECQRHYEIAANGAIPCFFELDRKNRFGAPFGLADGHNAIAFRTAAELEAKTRRALESGEHVVMAEHALQWAREHSCEAVAERFLEAL